MAYATHNFKTKKALKEHIAAGNKVTFFQPGPFAGPGPDGTVFLEGPHYPEPHRWYAQCVAKDGFIIKVK